MGGAMIRQTVNLIILLLARVLLSIVASVAVTLILIGGLR